MTDETAHLSVDQLKDALESLDWTRVRSLLDDAGGRLADPTAVGQALRRANGLLHEYPVPSAEKKREALFSELVNHLASGQPEGVPVEVALAIETLHVAEAGYRQLVKALARTDASKLDPALHVAAVVQRADGEVKALFGMLEEQAQQREVITPHIRLQDGEDGTLNPDAGLEHIVSFASMTIQMEAFKGKWFDAAGHIVIPISPEVTEEAVYQAGSTFLLATLWKRWKLTEQVARFLGGSLRFLAEQERPAGAPQELKKFIRHQGELQLELLHRVAAERMHDKLGQNLLEIHADRSAQKLLSRASEQKHLLPPRGYISNDELHACWAISEALAYDVRDDQERPGGLRLVEWIRGYCALKELEDDTKASELVRSKSGWQHYLAGYALPANVAERLIDQLTFRRSSRDLFDHPFVRRQDGKYLLFGAAFKSMNIAMVVLSAIGNLGEQFQKKGKSFEVAVRKIFETAGLKTYAFKATREGAEYEYDVVLPWGEYLFVFECKNRSLPNGNPVQMHFFDLETASNVRQVKRLMKALDDYPDILETNLPADAVNKKRVPAVLNCLPYSVPGGFDGVYFYDYSAMSRFFKNGQISVRSVKKGQGTKEVMRSMRLWKGGAPTPEDLLAQLEEPLQFKAVRDTLRVDAKGFPLPPECWVLSSGFQRIEHPDLTAAIGSARPPPATTGF